MISLTIDIDNPTVIPVSQYVFSRELDEILLWGLRSDDAYTVRFFWRKRQTLTEFFAADYIAQLSSVKVHDIDLILQRLCEQNILPLVEVKITVETADGTEIYSHIFNTLYSRRILWTGSVDDFCAAHYLTTAKNIFYSSLKYGRTYYADTDRSWGEDALITAEFIDNTNARYVKLVQGNRSVNFFAVGVSQYANFAFLNNYCVPELLQLPCVIEATPESEYDEAEFNRSRSQYNVAHSKKYHCTTGVLPLDYLEYLEDFLQSPLIVWNDDPQDIPSAIEAQYESLKSENRRQILITNYKITESTEHGRGQFLEFDFRFASKSDKISLTQLPQNYVRIHTAHFSRQFC